MSKLSDDDSRVVDLIMQSRSNRQSGDSSDMTLPAGQVDEQRLTSVSRVLDLLSSCPACEPPRNLAQRTIRRIESMSMLPEAPSLPAHSESASA